MPEGVIMSASIAKTEKLTKRFRKTVAVRDLDLEVPEGSVFALLGPNGAGKTTTLRMLLGMLPPTTGRSTVFGLDSQKESCAIKSRVGYVAEEMRLYGWMRIREVFWFTSRFYPNWSDETAAALLERFQLDPEKKIQALSRGTHAQVCLILALAHHPDLLILDEATGGLDVVVRRQFLEHIAALASEQGKTVLMASHLIHDVERIADWIAFIDGGDLKYVGRQEALKQCYRQIRLTFEDTLPQVLADPTATPAALPIPRVLRVKRSGREILLTVKDFSKVTEDVCRDFSPSRIEILDMSLEDIFEALAANGEAP